MKIKRDFPLIWLYALFLTAPPLQAQIPDSWSVNPHEFQYYATMTAEIRIDGIEESVPGTLAAFIDDRCTGTAAAYSSGEDHIFYLMIYSNATTAPVSFKFYYPESDTVLNVREQITFLNGGSFGHVDAPFILSLPPLFTSIKVLEQPEAFLLSQNFPNPFNGSTVIQINMPHPAHILLDIHDLSGKTVRQLHKGRINAGISQFYWPGENTCGRRVSSGTYIYTLKIFDKNNTRPKILTGKMIHLK